MRDGLLNYGGFVVRSAVSIAVIPLLLKTLGARSYGLWIFILTISLWVSAICDIGLFWLVASSIGTANVSNHADDQVSVVNSAGAVYLFLAVGGVVPIAAGALYLPRAMSEANAPVIIVFLLVAIAFSFNQLNLFSNAVLSGLRRFDLSSLIVSIYAVVWLVGVLIIFLLHGDILAVAICYAAAAAFSPLIGLRAISRLDPRYTLRIGNFNWSALRGELPFAFGSWLVTGALAIIWGTGPILIGSILGSAQIVPFYVGLKLPVAVSWMSWHAAEVLFPATSERIIADDTSSVATIIELGTHWNLLLGLPCCVIFWILAPGIMRAWLGPQSPPDAVLVMRLLTGAVMGEMLGVAALHVLWARRAMRPLVSVLGSIAAANITLNLCWLKWLGVTGAGWALLIPMTVGSLVLLELATRQCSSTAIKTLRSALSGLVLPACVCALVTLVGNHIVGGSGRVTVSLLVIIAGLAYLLTLALNQPRIEERRLLCELTHVARSMGSFCPRLRKALGRIPVARSGWTLTIALCECFLDSYRSPSRFQSEFQEAIDPWSYGTQEGRNRFSVALNMLDQTEHARFALALEIGCAEGMFTKVLASRCDSLLAVDFAPLALERARQHCQSVPQINFRQWNLRHDPLPRQYSLIVVMDVLSTIFRPASLQAACAKLIDAVQDGGYLLFGDVRQSIIFEQAWWNRYLMRGGMIICELLKSHNELIQVATHDTETHVFALFRKIS